MQNNMQRSNASQKSTTVSGNSAGQLSSEIVGLGQQSRMHCLADNADESTLNKTKSCK